MEGCLSDVPGCNLKDILLEKHHSSWKSYAKGLLVLHWREFVSLPGTHKCISESARKFRVQNNECQTSNKDGISILRFLPFEKLGLLLQDAVALTCDPLLIIRFLLCFETKSSSPPLFFCPHVFPVVPFQVLLSFPLFL